MGKQRNRRIFAVFYKRYDGKYIYVIAIAKDAETNVTKPINSVD